MRYLTLLLICFSSAAYACLETPLPTTPTEPVWTGAFDDPLFSASAEVSVWRHQCPGNESLLLITAEPKSGIPIICSADFEVVQGGENYRNFYLEEDPATIPRTGFCSLISSKTTFVVKQKDNEPQWDDTDAFELLWVSEPLVQVGALQTVDNGEGDETIKFEGSLSGSWFDPDRDGEGLVLEFSQTPDGRVAVLYWFTHREGAPYWLIASAPYETGQSEITFDLLEFSGTGFGADFDSEEIESSDFGAISLEFDSCSTGFATWETLDGETGAFNLRRITTGLDGAACN